jgi:hypothetical protein
VLCRDVVLCYVMLCCYVVLCYVMLCCVVMLCYVVLCYVMLCYVMLLAQEPPSGPGPHSFTRFLDHTQRCNTVGRTPLDE